MITFQNQLNPTFRALNEIYQLSSLSLKDEITVLRRELSKLHGCTVAIHGLPLFVVKHLLALDSLAAEVLVVPVNACQLFADRVLQALPNIIIIKEGGIGDGLWPTHKVWPTVHDNSEEDSCLNEQIATRWLIATSGTTSTPKLVSHTLETLSRSVTRKQRLSHAVWGLVYDPARFAGMQVVLQAIISGADLVTPDPRSSLSDQVNFFLKHHVNSLSATPTLWRKLLMTPSATEMPLRQITLGGEIADKQVLSALKTAYPEAHVTHIYASTEAGVGFAVHDGLPGFPAEWLKNGFGDMKLMISPQSTLMLRPIAHTQSYINSDQALFDENGWLDTQDLVEQVGDRVFFRGRINGSINVGGNKVMPEEVEQCIEELPFVQSALVRAKASSVAGSLLEALVVLDPPLSNMPDVVQSIKNHCRNKLVSYKVPAFVKIVEQLPITAAGKLARGA